MSIGGLGLRGHLLAGLAVTGLVCPTMVSADEIRILFVSSRDAGPMDAQVRKLERAIGEGGEHLPLPRAWVRLTWWSSSPNIDARSGRRASPCSTGLDRPSC